jgi:hypothetical protein
MLWSRAAAFLLLATMAAALSPAGQGDGCRFCGKLGRCCCLVRPAAARPASGHCAMSAKSGSCSLSRPATRPAAFRSLQTLPEPTGAFAVLSLPRVPDAAGRVTEAGAQRPTPFHLSPPTPPPRLLQLV